MQASAYPGRVIVTEPKGTVQPRVTVEKHAVRRVAVGEDVTLPCVAQGHPVPTYHWFRDRERDGPAHVALGERFTLLAAGLLRIAKVIFVFSSFFICIYSGISSLYKTTSKEITTLS